MIIYKLYQKYYRKSFFNKILFTYSIIMFFSMFILTQFILLNFGNILEGKELDLNSKILKGVGAYFEQKYRTSLTIYQRIYSEDRLSSTQLISFFDNDMEKGNKNMADMNFIFDRYLTYCFQLDSDLHDIIIKKDADNALFISESSNPVMREIVMSLDVPVSVQKNMAKGFTVSAAHNPAYLRAKKPVYTMKANIMNTNWNERSGEILVEFKVDSIRKAYSEYANDLTGYILVLTKDGDVIFDSSGKHYDASYPFLDQLNTAENETKLEEDCIINKVYLNNLNLVIAGIIPKSEIFSAINKIKRTVYLILSLCILASVILAYLNTSWISRRVRSITDAMKKLRKGDLSFRIHVGKSEDEISDIAVSFNRMCSDLENYINKVYLSEIRQKTAQLNALQSQVNPHFLYNTLETIRMRAITKGDEDAGEMIHMLATLFRSTIRDEMFIEIRNEIKYCHMYMEIFKIRFGDRLTTAFSIDECIEGYGIPKHLLQPVLENYIIHGFDTDRFDNNILIRGAKDLDDILFTIEDNGRGITEEKLSVIKESFNHPVNGSSTSIGLSNVNERIRLIFGEGYGLDIYGRQDGGTVVTLRLQAKYKEELKSYVQDIDSRR